MATSCNSIVSSQFKIIFGKTEPHGFGSIIFFWKLKAQLNLAWVARTLRYRGLALVVAVKHPEATTGQDFWTTWMAHCDTSWTAHGSFLWVPDSQFQKNGGRWADAAVGFWHLSASALTLRSALVAPEHFALQDSTDLFHNHSDSTHKTNIGRLILHCTMLNQVAIFMFNGSALGSLKPQTGM